MLARILFLTSTALLSLGTPLLAQINDGTIKPEAINELPMERPIVEYVLLVLFLLAAMGLGFFTSRRTSA